MVNNTSLWFGGEYDTNLWMTKMISKFTDTSMHVTKRDFHGGFENLHFIIWIADVSKCTKIRNVIAYFVVWNISPHNADKQ